MEKKNLNLPINHIHEINAAPARINEDHMQQGQQATMDVTGSLRKIARELSELRYDSDDLETRLEGASWLITYIADCLDVELQHAVERGRKLSAETNGNVEVKKKHTLNPSGQRVYGVIPGDSL